MFDLIKKTLLTGVGLAVMTKGNLEELVKDLVEKGKLSEKEGKAMVDDLLKKSEQAGKDLEAKVEKLAREVIAKVDVATKGDIAALSEKIERLERARREQSGGGDRE